jgi:hypothetical protein
MAIVLLAVGLLVTAAGFVTIGFGIPINAFSLGNTLIVAGTIGVATGLILIGLAAAIGQLRRIAEALNARGVPRAPMKSAEPAEATVSTAAKTAPAVAPASRAVEVPEPSPPPPEPRASMAPPAPAPPPVSAPPAAAAAGPLDWLRARPKAAPAAPVSSPPPTPAPTPEAQAPAEDAIVSARSLRQAPVTEPAPAVEPPPEPRVWSPSRSAPRVEQPMPRATPQPEPQKNRDDFNLVWPDRGAGPPPAEPARREEPPRREPQMPLPPLPVRPRESRPVTPRPPTEPRGPAILKSGVIDGMPYTLYADGSIEAELPQGTVKFASVDALRAHLEKHG